MEPVLKIEFIFCEDLAFLQGPFVFKLEFILTIKAFTSCVIANIVKQSKLERLPRRNFVSPRKNTRYPLSNVFASVSEAILKM